MAPGKTRNLKPNDPDAQALARWETEGGAPAPSAARNMSAGLAEKETSVLQCLGAAVLRQWNDLPTEIQRRLFDSSTFAVEPDHIDQLREQIARFLHDHKDEALPIAPDRKQRARRPAGGASRTTPTAGAAGSSRRSQR